MIKASRDPWIVKLHPGPSGEIWWADGDGSPKDSGLKPDEFLKKRSFRRGSIVRLSGEAANASLILRLCQMQLLSDAPFSDVQVCSPLAIQSLKRKTHPESAFFDLDSWNVSPSCGGWRSLGPKDILIYELVLAREQGKPLGTLLHFHPARFAVVSATLLAEPAAKLLAELVDPRFYVSLKDPDRISKLETFLGLNPGHASKTGDSRHRKRYELVTSCWKHSQPTKEEASFRPGLFLWDSYYRGGKNWRAELRTNQTMIRYLRYLWLEEIYRGKVAEGLFVAKYFFDKDLARVKWFEDSRLAFQGQ